jgi:hypothetical protein
MRKCRLFLLWSNLLCAVFPAEAQGTFQNLGFESARIVATGNSLVQFAPAFPGWAGYVGGVQQTTALYNNFFLDTSGISIIDHGWPTSIPFGGVIDGNFTAILQAGIVGSITNPEDTTLSQTALVPPNTESLRFKAQPVFGLPSDSFAVTLGGHALSLAPVEIGANYTLYAADVHSFAGQTAELDFTLFAERPHISNVYLVLDSIQFSTQAIPEPGALGLSALGALLLGGRVLGQRR